ncbi:nickel pincer cofactor biosynthesis protein LarB [Lentisphaerota bacterium ZTH]|nr:nickel pincer cofactor biosynthesis protein LarB [Lentisphaerota bacterium]WET05767.1 nickel pincer cofactor biosynthesis protein LarB [Lentisphaerota bacterium ZTH]
MDKAEKIINELETGSIDVITAIAELVDGKSVDNLGFACIDHDRNSRCGFPEFIYGAGKNEDQMLKIIPSLLDKGSPVLITRIEEKTGTILKADYPEGEYDELAGTFMMNAPAPEQRKHKVLILTAGTSDLGVGREALHTLNVCGINAEIISDVGVAGLQRLLMQVKKLRLADVVIVAAGMEGALPSVVGGLVSCPVIAVPTSVGYGAAMHGFAALAGMLNSCASGITVVNIDNGFGAACAAVRIINGLKAGK